MRIKYSVEKYRITEKNLRKLMSEINRIGYYLYSMSDSELVNHLCKKYNILSLDCLREEDYEEIICDFYEDLSELNAKYAC